MPNWGRFLLYFVAGNITGSINLVTLFAVYKEPGWELYTTVDVWMALAGAVAGALYAFWTEFGRGRPEGIMVGKFYQRLPRTPSPGKSGFAAGFAAFHLALVVFLLS